MPVRQGGKIYSQVLLDLHRYQLLERIARKRGVKPTALIREMVYDALQGLCRNSEYKAAEAADAALWADSVRRRVQGRQRSRAAASE